MERINMWRHQMKRSAQDYYYSWSWSCIRDVREVIDLFTQTYYTTLLALPTAAADILLESNMLPIWNLAPIFSSLANKQWYAKLIFLRVNTSSKKLIIWVFKNHITYPLHIAKVQLQNKEVDLVLCYCNRVWQIKPRENKWCKSRRLFAHNIIMMM